MEGFFNMSTQRVPGNGRSISLWEHEMGVGLLKYEYLNLYSHAEEGTVSIRKTVMAQQLWALFRPTLSDEVQQELCQLQHHINCMVLQMDGSDGHRWRWTASCSFTVKSAYMALKNGPKIKTEVSRIWFIKGPPRMLIFGWFAARNKILMQDYMQRRGWTLANRCAMCKSYMESVRHLFRDCPYAAGVYTMLKTSTPMQFWPSKPPVDITDRRQVSGMTTRQKCMVLVMHFVLWRERCTRIFRGNAKEPRELMEEIIWQSQLYKQTTRRDRPAIPENEAIEPDWSLGKK